MRRMRKFWRGASLAILLTLVLPRWSSAQNFVLTGSLNHARDSHAATLLADGTVLIAGGEDASGPLMSAELYDPATETFTDTGNMNDFRVSPTATLLPDGIVLIAGGIHGGSLPTAELYDPATKTFSVTGVMHDARQAHTATLLNTGKVLIAGGFDSGSSLILASAELYDPATKTFLPTKGSMTEARLWHSATLLPDGTVLIAGGYGATGPLASAEIYDPSTDTFSTTGSLSVDRYLAGAALVSGKVLLAGGYNFSGPLDSAELYDPGSKSFSAVGNLGSASVFHTLTALANNQVLVAGGVSSEILADAELYDPTSAIFSATGSMNVPRSMHTATLLSDGRVLVAGGADFSDSLSSAELYSPADSSGEDPLTVSIDIKPDSSRNPVNPKSKGKIPVAILSSETFDASVQIDVSTLTFGHNGDEPSLAFCNISDVDADGLMDLICHFDTQEAGFQKGDTTGILNGMTTDGVPIEASDSIQTVP